MADESGCLRVVEFYSGIGGMHYAIKECNKTAKVVAAFEINTIANQVYHFNFGETHLLQKNIEGLTAQDLECLKADVFLMSPPCQPFTRVGLQAASSDPRTKSFLHILNLLTKLQYSPDYILMENVKGFETSDTRNHFLKTLKLCKYHYQEFLLSPNQFGIPNSRWGYYLVAKKEHHKFCFPCDEKIMKDIPSSTMFCLVTPKTSGDQRYREGDQRTAHEETTYKRSISACCGEKDVVQSDLDGPHTLCFKCTENRAKGGDKIESCLGDSAASTSRIVGEYLEKNKDEKYFEDFLLPDKVLSRFALLLDIVHPQSKRSCCFTKAYGHYAEGTGSVIKTASINDTDIFNRYQQLTDSREKSELLSAAVLGLRYFTPREVANLHGFPAEFGFPVSVTVKQQYRLLGNSLNVHVVAQLLNCLFELTS